MVHLIINSSFSFSQKDYLFFAIAKRLIPCAWRHTIKNSIIDDLYLIEHISLLPYACKHTGLHATDFTVDDLHHTLIAIEKYKHDCIRT